tara:strand:- start:5484 stop:6074 length:591 start_codon:yes stop_codon:yes gene_type:complete
MTIKLTKRAKDRTGLTYGELTVVKLAGRNKHSQLLWECECSCGNITIVPAGTLGNRTKSCGCLRKNTNKNSTAINHQRGSASPYWKGHGEISGYKWRKIADSAKRRNLTFDITIEEVWELFLKQEKTCVLSDLPLYFGESGRDLGTASLDRIDSNKGYALNNVQWVHKEVNQLKMDLTEKRLFELCEAIVKKNNLL